VKIPRRDFIRLVGGTAAAWPLAARAQQPAMPVIGFLHSETSDQYVPHVRAFRQGLGESGYVEGKNVAIEFRWAESQNDRLPALAADLVSRRIAVIATNGAAVGAAKAATATIPIVFFVGGDPVKLGLVASLARPGGNLTGVTNLGVELGPKRLELLHELAPGVATVAVLVNPTFPGAEDQASAVQAAARSLSLNLHVLRASTEGDLENMFAGLRELRAGGLVVVTDPFFNTRQQQLATLALRHAMPTIYHNHEFVAAGGLAGWPCKVTDKSRRDGIAGHEDNGNYTGRFLCRVSGRGLNRNNDVNGDTNQFRRQFRKTGILALRRS
jgi:putative ABC transport system substrate-binding protein